MINQMLKVAIILGSTRPGRNGKAVSQWTYDLAKNREDAEFELIDIADYNLPLFDEPIPPLMGQYTRITLNDGLRKSTHLTHLCL